MSLGLRIPDFDAIFRFPATPRRGLGNAEVDIEDLRIFVEVADSGGVSQAARRLGLSKSIVSRALARLESEVGIQLLARTTRGTALTEPGATFREHAARITAEAEVAREAISPEGELRGRLRISAPLTIGPSHFGPAFAEMARRHPKLTIQTYYTDRFVDLIAEGYDCAIRVGTSLENSDLVAKRVGWISGKLVASPSYLEANGAPETPEDVVLHEALMQGTESWGFMDGDKTVWVRPQGRFKADNGVALVAAAVAGLGLAWVPDELTDGHLASGTLVPVMTRYPPPSAGIYVMRPPGRHPARKIRVLTDLLIAHCHQIAQQQTQGR